MLIKVRAAIAVAEYAYALKLGNVSAAADPTPPVTMAATLVNSVSITDCIEASLALPETLGVAVYVVVGARLTITCLARYLA